MLFNDILDQLVLLLQFVGVLGRDVSEQFLCAVGFLVGLVLRLQQFFLQLPGLCFEFLVIKLDQVYLFETFVNLGRVVNHVVIELYDSGLGVQLVIKKLKLANFMAKSVQQRQDPELGAG